ncbi:hypothetical protein GDO78_004414 [Eleutherodactylus coqui]|uniref:Uncharacterized protein n=1 Tax=Eleutherodactylus coqui TaxID=57060 RepID=A0A8J6ER89_ELECQ|nr:hypothetical protein GDO78_004414 [Eleutherodactylus coqui]
MGMNYRAFHFRRNHVILQFLVSEYHTSVYSEACLGFCELEFALKILKVATAGLQALLHPQQGQSKDTFTGYVCWALKSQTAFHRGARVIQ